MQRVRNSETLSLETGFSNVSASARFAGEDSAWLFSKKIDLTVFLGSAVLSLLLLAIGWRLGILNGESPEWTWVSAVLLIDVAHVWSTSFRVYFDKAEFKRRVWLYAFFSVAGYVLSAALFL